MVLGYDELVFARNFAEEAHDFMSTAECDVNRVEGLFILQAGSAARAQEQYNSVHQHLNQLRDRVYWLNANLEQLNNQIEAELGETDNPAFNSIQQQLTDELLTAKKLDQTIRNSLAKIDEVWYAGA